MRRLRRRAQAESQMSPTAEMVEQLSYPDVEGDEALGDFCGAGLGVSQNPGAPLAALALFHVTFVYELRLLRWPDLRLDVSFWSVFFSVPVASWQSIYILEFHGWPNTSSTHKCSHCVVLLIAGVGCGLPFAQVQLG